jgi:hypothetical protein
MRTEGVGKLILNCNMSSCAKVEPQGKRVKCQLTDAAIGEPALWLLGVGVANQAALQAALEKHCKELVSRLGVARERGEQGVGGGEG